MATNGRLPSTSLTTVQGTMRLEVKAAASWKRLVADIRRTTRLTALITSPDGAYRTYDRQKSLSGKGNHQYTPGHSVHGFGRSVDIYNWAAIGTGALDRIAAKHGWKRTIATEPWHYEYSPNRDTTLKATKPATKTTIPEDEDDMRIYQISDEKGQPKYTFERGVFVPIPEGQGGMFDAAVPGSYIKISKATKAALEEDGRKRRALLEAAS